MPLLTLTFLLFGIVGSSGLLALDTQARKYRAALIEYIGLMSFIVILIQGVTK